MLNISGQASLLKDRLVGFGVRVSDSLSFLVIFRRLSHNNALFECASINSDHTQLAIVED